MPPSVYIDETTLNICTSGEWKHSCSCILLSKYSENDTLVIRLDGTLHTGWWVKRPLVVASACLLFCGQRLLRFYFIDV